MQSIQPINKFFCFLSCTAGYRYHVVNKPFVKPIFIIIVGSVIHNSSMILSVLTRRAEELCGAVVPCGAGVLRSAVECC